MAALTRGQRQLLDELTEKHGLVVGAAAGPAELPAPGIELRTPSLRQLEVIALVSEGYTNDEIADRLFISIETVKSHVRQTLAKLGARSRTHAIAVAFRQGLIE